jgi:uncharacterized protein YfaS (alpha-2-macroglobulin family)
MKKFKVFFLVTIVAIVSCSFNITYDNMNEYKPDWKQVEKFVEQGLPKSALKIVDSIYFEAKKDNNTPQVLKSLIYRVSLQSQFEEDHMVNAIKVFENELESAKVPEKQLLQSMLAEMYSWYYQQNRWKINDMTAVEGLVEEDIRTWDAVRLNTKIREYYLASLKEKERLESIDIEAFSAILNVEEKDQEAYILWPTLFDLLANRAIEYFSTQDAQLAKIGDAYTLSKNYLVPVKDFVNIDFKEDNLIELRLYQRLLALHLKENNTAALVDLDLKRLKYVYSHLVQDTSNEKRYMEILSDLAGARKKEPQFVEISYELAQMYFQNGNTYKPGSGEQYRWDLNKADSICREAIKAFPDTIKSNACQNLINEINQVNFDLQLTNVELPGKPFLGYLRFKNSTKLYFKIVEVDPDQYREHSLTYREKDQLLKYLKNTEVHSWSVDLPDTKDHQNHATEISLPELSKGFYMIFISDHPDFEKTDHLEYNTIWISELSYITNSDSEAGSFELYVLNREKGLPISEVMVTTYRTEYEGRDREYTIKKLYTYQTDKNGYLKIDEQFDARNSSFMFSLQKDDDRLFSEGRYHLSYNRPDEKFRTQTYLFTDRAIYRPGQTVYFKGIVVDKNGNDVKIKPGYQAQVTLKNASYKEVCTIEKTSNEFGSFHGVFVIPQGGLNGRMTIKCETGSVSFQVEEYKRPTFHVEFDTIKDTYILGDEISVIGHAETYTGNAVSNASVKFRVVQQLMQMPYYRYYMYFPSFKEREIANGIIKTDDDGKFIISFETNSEQVSGMPFKPNYQFQIHVDVTDITGEVQSGETNMAVGRISKYLTINAADKIQKEKTKGIEISAKNIAGAEIDIETRVQFYRLVPPEQLFVERYWNQPDLYLIPEQEYKEEFPLQAYKDEDQKSTWKKEKLVTKQITIQGKEFILKEELATLEPGIYYITIEDVADTLIKSEKYITLYSTASNKFPEKEMLWSTLTQYVAEPGETIQLVVGSADKKTKILYELVNGEEVIERNWLTISREQKIIDITVKESYRGGFRVNLSSVKYNRTFEKSYTIDVPFTNKNLDITLETHRDFLTPGQKEAWKVKISGPGGEKVAAELLAGMYDASLDQFQPNQWALELYHSKRSASNWKSGQFRAGNSNVLINNNPDYLNVRYKVYPAINWFGYQQGYGMGIYRMDGILREKSMVNASGEMSMDGEAEDAIVAENKEQDGSELPPTDEVLQNETEDVQILLRTNFNETAFFYPQLQTDSSGSVILNFTTPDALTEWKLLMLSHTKDLKTGAFVEHIKAKKDLMVIPNVPRFMRQGDKLAFTAKVINYTDEQQKVNIHLELFDPVNMKVIDIMEPTEIQELSVVLEAKQSKVVQWKLDIPFNISMLGYRIKASSATFTDGEERMFPVLTNRMLVTETLPMHLHGNETRKFSMVKLVNSDKIMMASTRQNYRYTVEFTSNPAWYAIQALPYLSEPTMESASNLFHAYYTNVLASFIVNSDPKIKNVLESWKTHSPDAFLSNLQKNQELKSVVLNATPWVLEAENEEEQKRRIAVLFDINKISNQTENTMEKLRQTQLSSGAWSWFKGMRDDRYTTQKIVLGFARLNEKQVIDLKQNQMAMQMVKKAAKYLDGEIQDDYEKVLEKFPGKTQQNHIGSLQIQYLYARTLLMDEVNMQDASSEAFEYYLGQAKKYWLKQNNYMQAMIAVVLNRSGYRNEAEGILRSLQERSIQDDEMGMYWRQENGWYWYQAPVETQAMIIEAFQEILKKPALVDQMKIWLLKQKQTTHWKTTSATAEAVYALLMNGKSLLDNDQLVQIKVGNTEIPIPAMDGSSQAGTGYFKTSWMGEEIKANMGNIEVTNPNETVAWGAAYWQYFEQLDRITSSDSPLSIEKKLFIEKLTDEGLVLVALKDGQKLKTGDKVISRMIIATDRDMEYVQVNDMRATAFEPVNNKSGYQYQGGLGYYENITDVSTDFFIQYLRKGTYVLEYPVVVTQKGMFSNGIATIQSYYAPEFAAHSEGLKVIVD